MLRTSIILITLLVGCATTSDVAPDTTASDSGATGTLSVRIDPVVPETTLRIGDEAFAFPETGSLELTHTAGTYIVTAAAPGYRVARAAVIIEAGAKAQTSLSLEPEASQGGNAYGKSDATGELPERVAKGAANDAGKRTQSRVVRVYRNWIDRALDLVLGRL